MIEILNREFIYLWYYFTLQLEQIYKYWLFGMAAGSFVSVFGKNKIHSLFESLNGKKLSLFGIVPACILGIASPLCMYGTIPLAASFNEKGMREDWLASFMMASILLNPQLIIYSTALGKTALTVRIISCFMCGIFAGLSVNLYNKITGKNFFSFTGFYEISNHDTDPNILMRYIKNFGRNIKATGIYFLIGIFLTALFMRYVPAESFAKLFGRKNGFGVLMAATIGVPLYACGGGTIPLLQQWLADGMSLSSASAFMITGASTKITNLGALKIVLGMKNFMFYIVFVILFALINGLFVGVAFAETEALKWWQEKPVYQIYPKSFLDTDGTGTGDIKGITSKLDYLKDLGICAIWITPVYPSPMVDNGYDISDYVGINPSFGNMEDFESLIAEADKRGIKIVMDLVFNHSSDQHKWFIESKSSRDNPKSDWYIWRDPKPDGSVPTNWRAIFGGSCWTWCEERGQYYLHTFAKEQPDLNWENPEVRKALYDSANFWLSKGVGGFRIDAITYIKKPSEFADGKPDGKDGTVNIHLMTANQPGILDFLREFKREVFDGHDIFTVGEANGVSPDELKNWVGNEGVFNMLFEFSHVNLPFRGSEIWCYPKEWKLTDLKRAFNASQNATKNNGWYPVFFENHDQPRSVNHFLPEDADKVKAAKALATVLMTMRGTPFIYQGQELGMSNVSWNDINNYDDISSHGQYNFAVNEGFTPDEAMKFVRYFSRDNARTPMQWNSEINAGFSPEGVKTWLPVNENYVEVNAEKENSDKDSVLSFYKTLSKIRENNKALIEGDYNEIFSESEEIFAFERSLGDEKIVTVVNFSLNRVKIPEILRDKMIILSSEKDFNESELLPLEGRIYK